MAFSEDTKKDAWRRVGGKCECTRTTCGHHTGRCNARLDKWHAHHKTAVSSGGSDVLSNCEALCVPCHQNTGTYGR